MILAIIVATLVLWARLATGVIVLAWWYEPSQISRPSTAVGWVWGVVHAVVERWRLETPMTCLLMPTCYRLS